VNLIIKFTTFCLLLVAVSCSKPENASSTYDRSDLQSAKRTIKAQIVSKRSVKVKGGTGIGTSAGAATGYVTGATAGNGSADSAVGAIAGTIIGATIGSAIENNALEADATEYILEDDRSGLMTIIMTDSSFPAGSIVYVTLGYPPKIIGVAEN
jgi:outer membrane lipoprotein SlyB